MPVAKAMDVRAVVPDDSQAISEIAFENGLPVQWRWPENAVGAVATFDGAVVAFCALRELPGYGLAIEELWCRRSREGLHGLKQLGDWVEKTAQSIADFRNEPLACGGAVAIDNATHEQALQHRGYELAARVYKKTFTPRVA